MTDRDISRALKLLGAGKARVCGLANGEKLLLEAGERGRIAISANAARVLVSDGLAKRVGAQLEITDLGRSRLTREAGGEDAFGAQHRTLEKAMIREANGPITVTMNLDESPLSSLARRKDAQGRPLLSAREVAAGERLRSDYTRGMLMPRLGVNWSSAVASGNRAGGQGGGAELTEAAMAARFRVERAIESVGPELAGVLLDVCCYLKGVETVESERGWPARSAKLMLRSALSALARHYEPAQRNRGIVHWGAEGYRPVL